MASNDGAASKSPDANARPVMQMQVVLERLGFGSGIVDGKAGISTRNALSGFQEANGLSVTGKLDEATKAALAQWSNIPATRVVTIPSIGAMPTMPKLTKDPPAQAKLKRLGYESLDERLAERFHTTVEVLVALNPGKSHRPVRPLRRRQLHFAAGQSVRVPNVGADWIDAPQVEDRCGCHNAVARRRYAPGESREAGGRQVGRVAEGL